MTSPELPIVVIGAGPVGLAAAAHVLEAGEDPVVLEAGEHAGAAVSQWGHIKLFSPWQYNIDDACRRLLESTDWQPPRPTALPTGAELVQDYLRPLAERTALSNLIQWRTRVVAVSRGQRDKTHSSAREAQPFVIRTERGGELQDLRARAVIDASGTWSQPNPLGSAGLPAHGEDDDAVAKRLLGPLPDVLGSLRPEAEGKRMLVIGAGHSAVNTLLNLAALQREAPSTEVVWAIRGENPERTYGGGDRDGLPARGALGQRLRRLVETGHVELVTSAEIQRLEVFDDALHVRLSDGRSIRADAAAGAAGFRPDLQMLRELRLELDPAVESPVRLAPLIDPEFHSCGTVPAHGAVELAHPETDFFITGMKSYGRAPTFLLATGYEQVRSVTAHLAGKDSAARDLNLPETGVCSATDPDLSETSVPGTAAKEAGGSTSCCSVPAEPQPLTLGVSTGLLHGRSGGN